MSRHKLTLVCCIAMFTLAVGTPCAWSDMLPTHGAVVHLDSAPVAGWPVPPAFAPPVAGQVFEGDGNPPDQEYHVVGPAVTLDHRHGQDNLNAPTEWWHWESQLDLDPYLNAIPNPFVGGVVPVIFDFTLMGGPIIGPIPVGQAVGPEIYLHVDQPDGGFAGGPETGPVDKYLLNLTPWVLAWGTSVTEDPDQGNPVPLQIRKEIQIAGVNDPFVVFEPVGGIFDQWNIDWNGQALVITQVPEPSSVALLAIGGAFMIGVARHRRRRK